VNIKQKEKRDAIKENRKKTREEIIKVKYKI
jgi:hypothetical protein